MFENEVSAQQENKQKEQLQYLVIALLVGVGYYLFFFLPNERKETKKEIEEVFRENSPVIADDLDASLWKGFKSWQERLDKFYLPSQISQFQETMVKTIEQKKKDLEAGKANNLKEARENAIESIKKFAKKEIHYSPSFARDIKEFVKKIKKSSENDIPTIVDEANRLITQQKQKRQKLHWLQEPKNWADKKLEVLKSDFDTAWNQLSGIVNPHNEEDKEPQQCPFAASYTINFPPSLWNELSEEQKENEKAEELKLRSEVDNYTFNPKIDNWYEKALINPVRGERDISNIDNNATLYGAPRTGKSIIVEKLAYKADLYPLVVIQGSALTPTINDHKCSVDNLRKFFYTICDINNTLVDDFGFIRNPESGEPQYILFIDEANQISENTFVRKSSGLTFLKECMGSDNYKKNESHNLWIIATNHLSEIDEAVYQPGRLANRLNFSWTIGKFKEYSSEAGITSQFPQHWDINSLSEEDNKWVNRFNIIHFEESFLGRKINGGHIDNAVSFWDKFINNEENKKILNEEKETDEKGEEIVKKKGIQLGEFLQFFWQKFDSGELWDNDFDGKFTDPREPKMQDVVIQASNHISKALDARLKELDQSITQIKEETQVANNVFSENFNNAVEQITGLLSEIGGNMR